MIIEMTRSVSSHVLNQWSRNLRLAEWQNDFGDDLDLSSRPAFQTHTVSRYAEVSIRPTWQFVADESDAPAFCGAVSIM